MLGARPDALHARQRQLQGVVRAGLRAQPPAAPAPPRLGVQPHVQGAVQADGERRDFAGGGGVPRFAALFLFAASASFLLRVVGGAFAFRRPPPPSEEARPRPSTRSWPRQNISPYTHTPQQPNLLKPNNQQKLTTAKTTTAQAGQRHVLRGREDRRGLLHVRQLRLAEAGAPRDQGRARGRARPGRLLPGQADGWVSSFLFWFVFLSSACPKKTQARSRPRLNDDDQQQPRPRTNKQNNPRQQRTTK